MREKFPLGYVVWEDACHTQGERRDAIGEPQIVTTAGFIVRNDKSGCAVAMDVIDDGRLRGQTFIPRAYVRKVGIVRRNVASRQDATVHVPGRKFVVR